MSNGCMYRSRYGMQPECNGLCKTGRDIYCQYYYVDPVYTLINDWRKEACLKEPVLIKKNYQEKTIYIYTTKPGYLIGCNGTLIDEYQPKLLKLIPEFEKVELVPCDEAIGL